MSLLPPSSVVAAMSSINYVMLLRSRLAPLAAAALWVCLQPADVSAQTPPQPASPALTAALEPKAPINGFAEALTPRKRRAAPAKDVAYAPVKAVDDLGQIPEIEMFVGESRVLPAPGVGRIAVGNGRLLTAAALDKKEVLLFANEAGTSSLFIWNEDGRYQRLKINIVPGDTSRVGREIAAFLASIPGARASIVGDKVIVEGDRLSDLDLGKIKKLESTYPQLINFTNPRGFDKMVLIDVKVVEFPKSELLEYGLKWTPTGGGAVAAVWLPFRTGRNGPYQVNIPVSSGQSSLPITNPGEASTTLHRALNSAGALNIGLNMTLNLLAREGKAAVLAEPQLSTRSGKEASFLAGGQIPYVVTRIEGNYVTFKDYGIKLDIEPYVDRDGYITADIESEVSSIDTSVSTSAGPGIKSRKTKSTFNVGSGQTIVLSGLLSRDFSNNVDKLPFLGDLPVLGALFRSKRYQNNETELVVFVTPSVIDHKTQELVDKVDKAKERLEKILGPAPHLTEPLQPGLPISQGAAPSSPPTRQEDAAQLAAPATAPIAPPPPVVPATLPSPMAAAIPAPTTETRSLAGASLRVTLEGLALRAGPDLRSPMLMPLSQGAIVQQGPKRARGLYADAWRHVVIGSLEGWAATQWLEPVRLESAAVMPNSPGAQQSQRGKELNAPVTAAAVKPLSAAPAPDATLKSKPAPDETAPASAQPAAAATTRYRVALPKLALRVSPDVNAMVLVQVPEGTVVEQSDQPTQGAWTPIRYADRQGWVASQWLERHP
jgi:pilus assembly protein CpaC